MHGLFAYIKLPVAPLPQVDFPTIQVCASLPGASPETMASSVATPLERALGSIGGLTAIWSNSRQGSTNITLQFDFGRDIDAAARDVQAAINAARGQLPSGMPRNPVYRKVNPSQSPIMGLALSSPNLSPSALYDVASTILAQKISQVHGVGEVTVGAVRLPAVRMQLDPQRSCGSRHLARRSPQRVIRRQFAAPARMIEYGDRQWQVQVSAQLRQAKEYRRSSFAIGMAHPMRFGDVATGHGFGGESKRSGYHNDKPAVLLMIRRQPGANIMATIDAINEQLPSLRALLPADADLTVVMDRSPGIRATLREARFTAVALRWPGHAGGSGVSRQRARRDDYQRGDPGFDHRHVRADVPERFFAEQPFAHGADRGGRPGGGRRDRRAGKYPAAHRARPLAIARGCVKGAGRWVSRCWR